MSPRSRRRYLSRVSSANLRSRQRQRAQEMEDDIAKLESKVESLQQSINTYRIAQKHGYLPEILTSVVEDTQERLSKTARMLFKMEPLAENKQSASANSFHGRIAQLNGAMSQLVDCVSYIKVLKSEISQQVDCIEGHIHGSSRKHTSSIPVSFLVNENEDKQQ
ncbi:hypothetical protein GGI21_000509 [Coemansia aciculifera]|nr:hypothetical protein GGI21_000509 [Coemansia aciculifera]